ncbi:MAG: DUF2339 domain-containing protein [Candidatus Solibacter sp.]
MEGLLITIVMIVVIIRWVYLRDRMNAMEGRLLVLERASMNWARSGFPAAAPPPEAVRPAPPITPTAPIVPPPTATPDSLTTPDADPSPAHAVASSLATPDSFATPEAELPPAQAIPPPPQPNLAPVHRTSEEWEAVIGGNWVNKIGVFIAVVGIALLLNYAYTQLGAAGRVALSLGASFAMLAAGVVFERRETYRVFSYGLIGGGWAALYTTVYAMYAIPAAKVLESPFLATVLLLAVAAGIIAHSLKYRSQTVTGLAYFLAFVTLAIAEVTTFSVLMLIPLAASLLYIAWRNQWQHMAVLGLFATYLTCGLHKDSGSPLWQTQALFLVYWLIFEGFDLIRPDLRLLPLNALGFLALSAGKWGHAAPSDIWQLAAGAAALYLASTLVRARAGRWRPAVLFNAALATTAILLHLHGQWAPFALALEGELYYLAGVHFRSRFLRNLAGIVFLLQLGDLCALVAGGVAPRTWEWVAALTAAMFYLNRALQAQEVWYGYVGGAVAALVAGFEATNESRGRVWTLMAAAPFALGWWRRLFDFRVQGYALAFLGGVATAAYYPPPALSLAVGAALAYGFVHATLWSGPGRFGDRERDAARVLAAGATTLGLCTLVWRLVPGEYLGIAWLATALVLLEAGLRGWPAEFRYLALSVAILGCTRVAAFELSNWLNLVSAALVYAFGPRAREEARGRVLDVAIWPATLFLITGLSALLPSWALTPAWALVTLGFAEFQRRSPRALAIAVSALVAAHILAADLNAGRALTSVAPGIAIVYAAMLRRELASWLRLYFSLLGTLLLAALIFHQVSGSMLTIAWGAEAIVLLAAGFALRDRVLRISGLALFLVCTVKLFFWDLRNLETLPRIMSFIVLGVLLVAVSWVYTRFRAQVNKFL